MVFNGFVELVAVGAVPLYVRTVTDPQVVQSNNYLQTILPHLASLSAQQLIIWGGFLLFLIYSFKLVVNVLNGYFQERFIRGREMRISTDLLKRYLYSPLTFHLQRNTAELTRNAQIEIQQMNIGFIVPLLKAISQLFIVPLIFLALLWVNPFVSLLTLSILGAATIGYNQLVKKPLLKHREILQQTRSHQLQFINQALGGIKEVKVLHREDYFLNLYRKVMNDKRIATVRTQIVNRLSGPYLEFIALMGMLLIAGLLTFASSSAHSLAAALSFYVVAMFRLKQSVGILLDGYTYAKVNHITIRPIYEDIQGITFPKYKSNQPLDFRHTIQMKGINYTYPGSHKKALDNISLTIYKGNSVGIVGSTGAGKTTLVDILLGLLEPQEGTVMVDGQDIFNNLPGWHSIIGYIPQHIYLLDDTIRSNVAFGLPSDEIDDDAVWEALKTAQLADFVKDLPDGLNTITGERGIRLSGGQRQRIGIARALYRRPLVLILDEATAALDNKTEKLFVHALEQIRQDHTLIVIAHRLSTIQRCDRIFVMDRGKIKAEGNYHELLSTEKVFQELAQ
jgi:ATP-binding cassette subfamily C protein